MRVPRQLGVWTAMAAAWLSAGAQNPTAAPAPPTIVTTTREAHDLPPQQAAHAYPVHLRAVVVYYDPYFDARHAVLFVCDDSGCVFVDTPARPILPLRAGDRAEITGVTGPGEYTSVIVASQVRRVGQASLPRDAMRVTPSQILTGNLDCRWVELEGRVRSVRFLGQNVALQIASGDGSFSALSVRQEGADYESLVDSLVRARGIAAPTFNARGQMVGARIFFPALGEIHVVEPAPRDPFAEPVVPSSQLFRFAAVPELLHRVHLRGQVTLDWPGHILCIQDGKGGMCIETTQTDSVNLGALVDVLGFPAINQFKPTLEDASFRIAGQSPAPAPRLIAPGDALKSDLDGQVVQIDGELIAKDLVASDPALILRAGGLLFQVALPDDAVRAASLWKEGSILRVTGVASVQVNPLSPEMGGAVRPESLHILLRTADDVAVLRTPSWWTPIHTLESFAAIGLVVLAAFTWIVVLRRRVEQQTQALRSSEERLRHLSEHDALTWLPNRLLLNDRLRTSQLRVERFGGCLGLLMIDADGFKQINDTYGHQAGDRLLCELAARLTGCVRTTDTVARIGGDEFIVLLVDLHQPGEAESIASKIVRAAAQPMEIERLRAIVTVSVGVVTFPEDGLDAATLMRCADVAMYAAKGKGKNGFQVYKPKPLSPGEAGQALGNALHGSVPIEYA